MSTSALNSNLIHRVNVGDSLTRTAARRGDGVAIVDGQRRLNYADLNVWVNRVTHGLVARGYAPGDALALASGNSVEFLVVYYACAKLGVVCVPINLSWRTNEVSYVLQHSGSRGIVVERQLMSAMALALEEAPSVTEVILAPGTHEATSPQLDRPTLTLSMLAEGQEGTEPEHVVHDRDPITYLYTSGTTSFPKGVVGNHTAIYLESLTMALEARFTEEDRFVAMLPMFHTAQLNCHCTAAVMVGATIYIQRAFQPADLLELIEAERITQIFGLPVMYREMLEHLDRDIRDVSSLRRALYAMAPMPQDQLAKCIETLDCDFYLLFGQTEMSPTATLFRPEHQLSHPGAVGTPVVNVQVAIMDSDGNTLPAGETGEIVYRGPHTMTEYLHDAETTEAVFAHGWFHSGDMGRIDPDGMLWFSDRSKDVIKTGGENVASIEVEKAVYAANSDVAETVVVGLPHHRWGEAITAVVVPKAGAGMDEATLLNELRDQIDPYKVPKAVLVTDELPKTSTGKIQKHVLREQLADHYTAK